jgi:hypothetical protein
MKRYILLVVLAACTSAKGEASAVVGAVDAFRRAANADKVARAGALEGAQCSDAEVCAARDACLASTRPTVDGLRLKAQVETALADLDAGKISTAEAAGQGLAQKLDDAAHDLAEGHAKLPACDVKIVGLRMKYGL